MVCRTKIVIVGAGLAGLGAAHKLVTAGFDDFVILEAYNRPGGRIYTLPYGDNFIELGAQWLHSPDNALWKFGNKYDLFATENSGEAKGVFVRNDGCVFDQSLVDHVDFIVGKIFYKCESFVRCTNESVPESVGEYLEEKFEEYLKQHCSSDDLEVIAQKREIFNWHVRFQMIDNSCNDLKHLSAKKWGLYSCSAIDGQQHINMKTGYSSLIDHLCKCLPNNSLLLNHIVENITWDYNREDTESPRVLLTCKNGFKIEADFVIFTGSVGFLKKFHREIFTPRLPDRIQRTIEEIGFGGVNKVFLKFPYRWWKTEGFQLIWEENEMITEFGKSQTEDWPKYLTGFDEVLNQPNVLLGWIGGNGARIIEDVSEEEIALQCTNLLRKITGENVPVPEEIIRTKWASDPFIRGGYCYLSKDCDAQDLGPNSLRQPVCGRNGTPVLVFAGEACHESHFSTTHGAFESGLQQAEVILNSISST